jgi:hypothetical protein
MTHLKDHADVLERELAWVGEMIDAAFHLYFGQECSYSSVDEIAPPPLPDDAAPSGYALAVHEHRLTPQQRLVLMLALIPHVRPQMLDPFLMKNENFGRGFTEFGGAHVDGHGGFWPTAETAAFILAGDDLALRLRLQALFEPDGVLSRARLIDLQRPAGSHSMFGQVLHVGRERLAMLTTGAAYQPEFGRDFPARRITTELDWPDLVLDEAIRHDVDEIRAWIEHGDTLMRQWQLERQIKPGFRSLFYGPPGTGKTLTACLLGKSTGLDVYRVDLSLVVSKYIGETEKNLAGVFEQAERQRWILFFDEADALFGKRTQTSSSNDRYANQEVAYLLQRLEDFPGVVILATNLKSNIDDAFARRFQSMIYFPMPTPKERLHLWRKAFALADRIDPGVDLGRIADEFELAGGAIINVLRYASLMCLRRGEQRVSGQDIRHGIKRELWKDGKVV